MIGVLITNDILNLMDNPKKKDWRKMAIIVLMLGLVGTSYGWYQSSKLYNHLSLPSFHYFEYGDYYVSVEGTLTSSTDELANKFHTLDITCNKTEKICRQAQADTVFNILSVYTQTFNITDWNDQYITFSSEEDTLACVKYDYRIDRLLKTLNGVRTTINTAGTCEGMSTVPMKLELADGLKISLKLQGR